MKRTVLISLTIFFLATSLPVFAVEEATPSAFPSQQIKEKIKERLEKTATESAEAKSEEKEEDKYYAWVGTLNKVEDNLLFIQADEGEKEAEVDKQTTILQTPKKGSRKEVAAEKLEVGNFIIAMGTLSEEKIIAKRVISTPPLPNPTQKKVVFGKVTESEEGKITLLNKNKEENTLIVDKETSVTIKGVEKAEFADIQLEDKVYASVVEEDKILKTKAVFVIPGKYSPENETKKKLEEISPATPSGETKEGSPSPSSEE